MLACPFFLNAKKGHAESAFRNAGHTFSHMQQEHGISINLEILLEIYASGGQF